MAESFVWVPKPFSQSHRQSLRKPFRNIITSILTQTASTQTLLSQSPTRLDGSILCEQARCLRTSHFRSFFETTRKSFFLLKKGKGSNWVSSWLSENKVSLCNFRPNKGLGYFMVNYRNTPLRKISILDYHFYPFHFLKKYWEERGGEGKFSGRWIVVIRW